jgi:hypothetical protein
VLVLPPCLGNQQGTVVPNVHTHILIVSESRLQNKVLPDEEGQKRGSVSISAIQSRVHASPCGRVSRAWRAGLQHLSLPPDSVSNFRESRSRPLHRQLFVSVAFFFLR